MKTVKVRIAVAVDTDGCFAAIGWDPADSAVKPQAEERMIWRARDLLGAMAAPIHWVEAEIPVPDEIPIVPIATVAGTVSP